MIKKLQSVMIYVEDVEKAKAFWTEKLGFVVKEEIDLPEYFMGYEIVPSENVETSLTLF